MSQYKCFYHLIWATKYRQPRITPALEHIIFPVIRQKCYRLQCEVIEINGIADHIHVVACIHPKHSVAEVVRQIKGISSYEVNQARLCDEAFHWQTSYGVYTFGEKALPQLIEYVAQQKQRHQTGALFPYMEHIPEFTK